MSEMKLLVYVVLYSVLIGILFYVSPILATIFVVTLPLRWMLYNWINRKYGK